MAEDLSEGHDHEPVEVAEPLANGWRPDPFGRLRYRWWDGETWTALLTNGRETEWDAEPVTSVTERSAGLPGIAIAVLG